MWECRSHPHANGKKEGGGSSYETPCWASNGVEGGGWDYTKRGKTSREATASSSGGGVLDKAAHRRIGVRLRKGSVLRGGKEFAEKCNGGGRGKIDRS